MVDIFTKEKRSDIMSRIKGKNTKPELIVRSILHRMGYRFRLHKKELPGKPDIVLEKYKTVIFVHGCYWHRHDCKRGQSLPSSREAFWRQKFKNTIIRDQTIQKRLICSGWNVGVIWQCELKDPNELINCLDSILNTGKEREKTS